MKGDVSLVEHIKAKMKKGNNKKDEKKKKEKKKEKDFTWSFSPHRGDRATV